MDITCIVFLSTIKHFLQNHPVKEENGNNKNRIKKPSKYIKTTMKDKGLLGNPSPNSLFKTQTVNMKKGK